MGERTPDVCAGSTGHTGTVVVNVVHHIEPGDAPTRKVSNYPTFRVGVSPVTNVLVAANDGTKSDVVANYPNEGEPMVRYAAAAYGPLALLHVSVLLRIVADLAAVVTLRGVSGVLTIVALVAYAATLAIGSRQSSRRPTPI